MYQKPDGSMICYGLHRICQDQEYSDAFPVFTYFSHGKTLAAGSSATCSYRSLRQHSLEGGGREHHELKVGGVFVEEAP